jgi:hypothetical protein
MGVVLQLPGAATPVERFLSQFDRAQLAGFIEVAIGLLDMADGDPDREDDDPAGDPLDITGEPQSDDGRSLYPTLPAYGEDQRRGPINHKAAQRAHYLSQIEDTC